VRPGLPGQLNGIILHSMAKEPLERFQTAEEFRQSLDSVRRLLPAPVAGVAAVVPIPAAAIPSASIPTAATGAFGGAATPATPSMEPPPALLPASPPTPSVMELSPKPHKGRGLYMALGAVIVLVVLVLAGLSFPRWLKTRAAEKQKPAEQSTADQNSSQNSSQSPNSAPASPPAADGSNPNASSGPPSGNTSADTAKPDSGAPSSGSTSGTAPSSDANASGGGAPPDTSTSAGAKSSKGKSGKKGKSKASDSSGGSNTDQGSSVANTAPNQPTNPSENSDRGTPGADAGQKETIEELEQDVDQTSSRATAAGDSLDNMSRQLKSQGMNLRGDIASSQELMKTNLEKARQALQNNDAKNARRYLNMAQAQMEKIEKFLGH
jgi:serine/threonine-protein kinase